ncbi:hypothetical protein ACEPAH_2444 [Sanghuangporus vaninii]
MMGGSNHRNRHHGQSEHLKSAASQTGKQEGSRDKAKDKRPKLVKAKHARAEVDRDVASLRKNHIDHLNGKTVIYQSELAFINRIGELLLCVEEAWKAGDAANERAKKTEKELQELRAKAAGRKGEDGKETGQKSDPNLGRLEDRYWSELTISEECEEYWVTCSKTFIMEYHKAHNACVHGFESITLSKRDEEEQFLSFCENVGKYVTETSGKTVQDIQATVGIVNKARTALEGLSGTCDAIQTVMKDLEKYEAIWRDSLSGDGAGYVEKSVLEEAKTKLENLKNSAKETEASEKEMKQKLKTAMTYMQKLRFPSRKESKKR